MAKNSPDRRKPHSTGAILPNPAYLEILAEAIHRGYVEKRLKEGAVAEDDPALRPWHDLPETLKESNRQQAADIWDKANLLGYEIRTSQDCRDPIREISGNDVELLARKEHDRWMQERVADGWIYDTIKDVEKKRNPYLVPYEDLPAESKDRDRDVVRTVPSLLARVGLCLVRKQE